MGIQKVRRDGSGSALRNNVEKTSVRPLRAGHPARYLIPEPLPAILLDAVTSEEIPPATQVRFAPKERREPGTLGFHG